ncbi:MAG: prephenate dehydrogenase/arogenate dehydrogenase family protein [Actinomycetota bacterium]
MFAQRMAVLGTGLIGGSIALGARSRNRRLTVVGFDGDPATAAAALSRGALTSLAASPEEAVAGADLIVLAMPIDRIAVTCEQLAGAVGETAAVTDVGSAKEEVVAAGEAAFGGRFVGAHPMAGSERHGIDAADARLFEDAWWVLTPTANTSSDAYSRVAGLATSLGAKTVAVDPVTHDALVARLSHVPQLTASALVDMALTGSDKEALLGLAGAGFRDVTRIAASNPDLWVAILRSNKAAVGEALAALEKRIELVADMIAGDSWDELRSWLDTARVARLELFAKPDYDREPIFLSMIVPDRPGVLAEVTTEAGRLGTNIEDLRIVHSTEGGRGRLELVVAGDKAADILSDSLTRLGYRVERSEFE